MIVTFVAAEPSGLAEMLGGLIEQNLAAHPSRRRSLRPSVVAIEAVDAGVGVTLTIERTRVTIGEGIHPRASVRIHGASATLLEVVAVPVRWGLPDPSSQAGRALVGSILRRRLRIEGLIRHPARVVRFLELLTVHQDRP